MMRAAELAWANEHAARARIEGMLRDAEATIRDLREKLTTANQNLNLVQAELSSERLAQHPVDDGVVVIPGPLVPTIREGELPVVRMTVGRPRKIVAVKTAHASTTASDTPLRIVSPNVEAACAIVRRRVGRPRKTVVEPIQRPTKLSGNAQLSGKAHKSKQMVRNRGGDDHEPVQWWVEGWKGR